MHSDPFAHDSTPSTPEYVITGNGSYTVITEAEDYLGVPEFGSEDDDLDVRYDTVQHLNANEVVAYANGLAEDGRCVAIFEGRLSDPRTFPAHTPIGYVEPGRVWSWVSR